MYKSSCFSQSYCCYLIGNIIVGFIPIFYRHLYQFDLNYMYLASGLCFREMERHKGTLDSPAYSKCFGYIFFCIYFFRRVQQVCLSWTDLPLTAIVQLPGCCTLQKSCCKEKSEQLTGLWKHMGDVTSNVPPGMRSPSQCKCLCQAKLHLPAPGPTVTSQHRAGDAFRQFYFHRTMSQETLIHPREQEHHNYTIIW